MTVAKADDEQSDDDLDGDQAVRPGRFVDRRKDHLGKPLMIEPELAGGPIGVGVDLDDRTGPEDVLAEADMAPEIRVGDRIGEPEYAEADEQAPRGQGEEGLRSSRGHRAPFFVRSRWSVVVAD